MLTFTHIHTHTLLLFLVVPSHMSPDSVTEQTLPLLKKRGKRGKLKPPNHQKGFGGSAVLFQESIHCSQVLGYPSSEPGIFTGSCGSLRMSPLSTDQVTRQRGRNAGKGVCVSRWLSHRGRLNLSLLQLFFHEQTSISPISLKTDNTGAFIFSIQDLFMGMGFGVFP